VKKIEPTTLKDGPEARPELQNKHLTEQNMTNSLAIQYPTTGSNVPACQWGVTDHSGVVLSLQTCWPLRRACPSNDPDVHRPGWPSPGCM